MTWGRGWVEYFCIHKRDNKCSSWELNTFSVLLQNAAWCQIKSAQCGRAAPVPCVHLLMPQGEHLLHGRDSSASKAFVVLAHFDGLQPLGHRPEHGAVTAAGAGQADGYAARDNVCLDYSSFNATLCTLSACDDVWTRRNQFYCQHTAFSRYVSII